jgi:flagellar L-ring protein precursor FlgH
MGLEGAMANIGLTPAALIGATSTNDFDGSGGTKRSGELSGTVTAWVTDVLPNGLLVIGGRQAVKINNEVEVLALRGVVDPRAIDSSNTIASSSIADARVEYTGTGVVAGKQAPGWLTRALDVVWPF